MRRGKGDSKSGVEVSSQREMATWIAFALGCATTALLFLTYLGLGAASDVPQGALPTPEPRFGGGFGFLPFNNAVISVLNVTYEAHSFPYTPEAPRLNLSSAPLEGKLRLVGEPRFEPSSKMRRDTDASRACSVPESDLSGSIALVKAGGCSVTMKLLNCQAAGAEAVVIESDGVRGSSYGHETTRIPGVSVTPATYTALLEAAGETASMWSLRRGIEFTTTDVLMLLVVRPVMLFSIVAVLLACNLGCSESRRTAPPRVVAALPTHIWAGAANGDAERGIWNQDGCRICLEDFVNGCEVMTLPCGHEFHSHCVSAWLLKQREVCPLCKMRVDRERIPLLV